MSTDKREYIRVSVDLPIHPKLASLDDPAAGWLYVVSLIYCGEHLTDGLFLPVVVYRLSGVSKEVGARLVEVGMWHDDSHDCPDCPRPPAGQFVVHDYLQHQRSRASAEQVRRAGRVAAAARWGKRDANRMRNASGSQSGTHADGNADDVPLPPEPPEPPPPSVSDMRFASDSHAEPNAEEEGEEEKYVTSPSVGGAGGSASQQAAKPKRATATRGTRLQKEWVPDQDVRDDLDRQYPGQPSRWWWLELEKFRNHFVPKTGKGATSMNWNLNFRNWIHEAARRDGLTKTIVRKPSRSEERAASVQALKTPEQPPSVQVLAIEGVG